MQIIIRWFEGERPQFNVALASTPGKEPFIEIKGCRIVEGKNGPFVSWPARKLDDGKYWNHVYASEAFNLTVLSEAQKTMPARDTRTLGEQRRGRPAADEEAPF